MPIGPLVSINRTQVNPAQYTKNLPSLTTIGCKNKWNYCRAWGFQTNYIVLSCHLHLSHTFHHTDMYQFTESWPNTFIHTILYLAQTLIFFLFLPWGLLVTVLSWQTLPARLVWLTPIQVSEQMSHSQSLCPVSHTKGAHVSYSQSHYPVFSFSITSQGNLCLFD